MEEKKPRWYRRTWVAAVATGLVGIGIGTASAAPDVKQSPEYKSLSEARETAMESAATSLEKVDELTAKVAKVEGTLPQREAAVTKSEKDLGARQTAVTALEKAVRNRETAVGIVEKEIANNTLSGEGTYEVGVDAKAGMYKTKGGADCYYAVLNTPDSSDIADNGNITGPGVLRASKGQFIQLSGCADWVLQR